MALKEISDLNEKLSINSSDFFVVKQGSEDVKVRPSVVFDLHKLEDNPHSITKLTIGLNNVTDDAQLTRANNLSDLTDVAAARAALGIYSTGETDGGIASHAGNVSNPHSVTKAQVGLGSVPNYSVSNDPDENVTTKFASIAAVNLVRQQANVLATSLVPVGAIMMWSTNDPIPAGWVAMDGLNNTIDLRGKFPRGGDAFSVGDEGGSDTTTLDVTATVGETILTVDQMPSHSHEIPGRFSSSGDTEGGSGRFQYGSYTDQDVRDTGGDQGHDHPVTVEQIPVNKLPSYYTLIFIQKV